MNTPIMRRERFKPEALSGHTPDRNRETGSFRCLRSTPIAGVLLGAMALWLPVANAQPTVAGNVIEVPDDGWHQVQSATDYASFCQGVKRCTVPDGTYIVINHTTGQRFTDVIVPMASTSNARVMVNGNTISWPDDDWYQVQDANDYRSVCEGGNSCTVEPGMYHIINLTTGVRIDNFQVGGATPETDNDLIAAALAPVVSASNQVSWAFSPVESDVTLIVEPFVEMPLASNGNPARWNAMTTLGDKLFIVDEQDGRIYEITGAQPTLWFDMAAAIQSTTGRQLNIDNAFHGGVRSIAFHPDFASNGKLYASLLEERPADPELHHYLSDAATLNADSVLVEWSVDTSTMMVDPASYREVFRVGIPEYDHPIKQIVFDPSARPGDEDYGLLYIAHGDGSKESTTTVGGQGNNALGKILRINPLIDGATGYSIPASNPYAGVANMLDEAWSIGHRNPHHPAFMQDGTLLVGEDGRDNIDEVNLIVAGGDYGWSQREGAYVQLGQPGLSSGIALLPDSDANSRFIYPVAQYGHTGSVGASFTGQALGGGFVVENDSELNGLYFYIDFAKSGEIFHSRVSDLLAANTQGAPDSLTVARTWRDSIAFDHDSNPATEALSSSMKTIVQSASGYVNTNDRVDIRYGQGPDGELYLFSKRNNMVYRVSNSLPSGALTQMHPTTPRSEIR